MIDQKQSGTDIIFIYIMPSSANCGDSRVVISNNNRRYTKGMNKDSSGLI